MGAKKKWSAEEKLAVVLDGLKGRPVKEICREDGISVRGLENLMRGIIRNF